VTYPIALCRRSVLYQSTHFQGFPFYLARRLPGAEEVNYLGLEQADDALGQGVVVAVTDAADRGVEQCPKVGDGVAYNGGVDAPRFSKRKGYAT